MFPRRTAEGNIEIFEILNFAQKALFNCVVYTNNLTELSGSFLTYHFTLLVNHCCKISEDFINTDNIRLFKGKNRIGNTFIINEHVFLFICRKYHFN